MKATEGKDKQTVVTFVVNGGLYPEFQDDLENILHDNQTELEYVKIKEYPWKDIYHEVVWWITRRLTMKEWGQLDDAETEVICKIVGEDNFMGTAGPIPFDD